MRLCLRAGPARHRVVPALDVLDVVGNLEGAHRGADVDSALGGDMGDGVALTGDEWALREDRVEPFEPFDRVLALDAAEFRKLLEAILEEWMSVLHRAGEGGEYFQLHAAAPPLDQSAIARDPAHPGQLGQGRFDVAADRHRFGEINALVEFEGAEASDPGFV